MISQVERFTGPTSWSISILGSISRHLQTLGPTATSAVIPHGKYWHRNEEMRCHDLHNVKGGSPVVVTTWTVHLRLNYLGARQSCLLEHPRTITNPTARMARVRPLFVRIAGQLTRRCGEETQRASLFVSYPGSRSRHADSNSV